MSGHRFLLTLAASMCMLLAATCAIAASGEWLSLGSKHWAPAIISKSGIGSADATAQARVTREEIEGWCANWTPDDRDCVRTQLASPEAKKTWHASADCTRGRITPVDGNTYTLAGRWDHSDIGGGRTRWRDAAGHIVGRDNASGGLAISQQWEVLCPETAATPRDSAPRSARSQSPTQTPRTVTPGPRSNEAFAVGEVALVKYGSSWIRARITRISQVNGARGPELAYHVTLENGERGVLPVHMMRRISRP